MHNPENGLQEIHAAREQYYCECKC